MKKIWLHRLLVLTLCVMLMLFAALPAGADFGDFSGDSDFGDSSDWSSSDSIWDSSDSSWDSESTDDVGFGTVAIATVIILVVCFAIGNIGSDKGKPNGGMSRSAASGRTLKAMEEYRQLDEHFDAADLTSKLSNLYVQMQDCWQKKEISSIRPYCTDAFFTQMDNQLRRKKQNGQTNYIERIAVLSAELCGWCQEGGNDVIVARLRTRIVDYTLDDVTGKLISGDRNREKFMTYEWDLIRPTGTKTETGGSIQTVNCPNCGAPLEINASAKCPYCGSVVTLEEHGFALNAIRAIAQESES